MSARDKLNGACFIGAGVLAGLVGLVTQSVVVFLICLVGLLAVLLHDGGIRL